MAKFTKSNGNAAMSGSASSGASTDSAVRNEGIAVMQSDRDPDRRGSNGRRPNRNRSREKSRDRIPGSNSDYRDSLKKPGHNDVSSWELKGVTDNLSSIVTGWPSGSILPQPGPITGVSPSSGKVGVWSRYQLTQPGIMTIEFIPNLGFGGSVDALNVATIAQEQMLRTLGTGAVPYQASDIVQYWLAVASLHLAVLEMRRACYLANTANPLNRYWGNQINHATGYDWKDLVKNRLDIISKVNALAQNLWALPLPDIVTAYHEWGNDLVNVFKDSESERSGYYVFHLPGIWYYDWQNKKCSFKTWADLATQVWGYMDDEFAAWAGLYQDPRAGNYHIKLGKLCELLTSVSMDLQQISDIGKMTGDMAKLYGGKRLLGVRPIEDITATIKPILNWEKLQQIENLSCINVSTYIPKSYMVGDGLTNYAAAPNVMFDSVLTHKPGSGSTLASDCMVFEYTQNETGRLAASTAMLSVLTGKVRLYDGNYHELLPNPKLLNFRMDNPDSKVVLLNTRYITHWKYVGSKTYPAGNTGASLDIDTCGMSLTVGLIISVLTDTNYNPNTASWNVPPVSTNGLAQQAIGTINTLGVVYESDSATTPNREAAIFQLSTCLQISGALTTFDYAPFVYFASVSEVPGSAAYFTKGCTTRIGDYDVIYPYTLDWLRTLNSNVVLAAIWIPNLSLGAGRTGGVDR